MNLHRLPRLIPLLLLWWCASVVHAADYTVTLSPVQEIALAAMTEETNARVGIVYATGASVTQGNATVLCKSAVAGWSGKWLKVTGDTGYYKITAVTAGTSVSLASVYTGLSGSGKDVTLHPDDGALPTSAALPDRTKAQVFQDMVSVNLGNALRNLDARITPVLQNLKSLDATTQALVLATDPSPAARARAAALAAAP